MEITTIRRVLKSPPQESRWFRAENENESPQRRVFESENESADREVWEQEWGPPKLEKMVAWVVGADGHSWLKYGQKQVQRSDATSECCYCCHFLAVAATTGDGGGAGADGAAASAATDGGIADYGDWAAVALIHSPCQEKQSTKEEQIIGGLVVANGENFCLELHCNGEGGPVHDPSKARVAAPMGVVLATALTDCCAVSDAAGFYN
ncbi:unnamed protein product [Closterium sp. NIES-53]